MENWTDDTKHDTEQKKHGKIAIKLSDHFFCLAHRIQLQPTFESQPTSRKPLIEIKTFYAILSEEKVT